MKQIDQAFALVRTIVPDVSHERWRDFAAALMGDVPAGRGVSAVSPNGIMSVQNGEGYILGLFCYRTCDHLRHGTTLMVDHLIVVDLFDTAGAFETLLLAMERLGQDLGCSALHTDLPSDMDLLTESCRAVLERFRGSGGTRDAARLLKLLEPAPCRPLRRPASPGGDGIVSA